MHHRAALESLGDERRDTAARVRAVALLVLLTLAVAVACGSEDEHRAAMEPAAGQGGGDDAGESSQGGAGMAEAPQMAGSGGEPAGAGGGGSGGEPAGAGGGGSGGEPAVDGAAGEAGAGALPLMGLRQFGTTLSEEARAVAFDHQGSLLVAGDGALSEGGEATFVLKLAPDLSQSWAHLVESDPNPTGMGTDDEARALCVDVDDNVIVGGVTGGVLVAAQSAALDGYVRKLSPSGAVLWTRQLGGTHNDTVDGVATDSDGSVLLTGTLDFQGNSFIGDAYVRKLDQAGKLVWQHEFTPSSAEHDYGVAIDLTPSGDPVVVGLTLGDVASGNLGKQDYFVSKLDADTGNPLWTVQYGTADDDCVTDVAADASGDVLVTGQGGDCLDFADPSLDAFLVKLDGDDGSTLWRHDIDTSGEDRADSVFADELGNVLVAGRTGGSIPGAEEPHAGQLDVYVQKLDSSGNVLWTHLVGNAQNQRASAVTSGGDGMVVMVGTTQGDLGGKSAGGWDAFLAWFQL